MTEFFYALSFDKFLAILLGFLAAVCLVTWPLISIVYKFVTHKEVLNTQITFGSIKFYITKQRRRV